MTYFNPPPPKINLNTCLDCTQSIARVLGVHDFRVGGRGGAHTDRPVDLSPSPSPSRVRPPDAASALADADVFSPTDRGTRVAGRVGPDGRPRASLRGRQRIRRGGGESKRFAGALLPYFFSAAAVDKKQTGPVAVFFFFYFFFPGTLFSAHSTLSKGFVL